jgi:RimJ/RimL family protein N-acetyltransferase
MFLDSARRKELGILANFAVVLNGRVIGEVYLNQRSEDRESDRAEIGYSLSSLHWGQGLTTEAARAVVDWAFHTFLVNRMYTWSDPRNIGSWRVMEKLGMAREACCGVI